jgi:phage/plasmid-like protein (TIGR03299 family)
MAHEIDFTTGVPAIAYTGEKPWHGYGQVMPEGESLDTWRVRAGLDWEVNESPIYHNRYLTYEKNSEGVNQLSGSANRIAAQNHLSFKIVPNKKILTRSDNSQPLSVVSSRYKVVQPKTIIEFFESVIKENGFKMSTAGALKGGKRVWAMADCGKDFHVNGDRVGAHLLLATSYDGTFATTAQFTSIRVVCNNTLGFSLDRGGEGGIIKIPHTQDFKQWDVKADLGFDVNWITFRDNIFKLSEHKVTKRQALEYFLTVVGVTEEEAADGKQLSNVKKLISYYESGPGAKLPSADGTLWGALNAVTFLADHGRRAASTGNRFDSASFGSGAAMKRKAFVEAVRIAA